MLIQLLELLKSTGFANLEVTQVIMIIIALILLYLGIVKGYEPLLLVPISFGMLLVNLPLGNLMKSPIGDEAGGLLYYLYQGIELGIYPPLIFLGVGAMTDFGPLIANPMTLLLGAAAQLIKKIN
jgi:Na+-transporting methylmalonyl-CoA/oxaloacetate decarboxylase beta subunit